MDLLEDSSDVMSFAPSYGGRVRVPQMHLGDGGRDSITSLNVLVLLEVQ
jgi:hypothetical protein